MSDKDKVESGLAILVIMTFCILAIYQLVSVEAFTGLAMYIVKKTMDGIADTRSGGAK